MVVHPGCGMFAVFMNNFKSILKGYNGREVTGC
jgi:hypothetical protein